MKTLEYTVAGTTWHLCLNGAALFDAYEKFGDKAPISSHIEENDKAAFLATCWLLYKLAEQGELVRRYLGFTPAKFPTEHTFRALLRPMDVVEAKKTIREALHLGFLREEPDEDKAVDLGLLELQKKTAPG